MCLDPEAWEAFYLKTTTLSDEKLIELDLAYQANGCDSIDRQLHYIVKLVMQGRAPKREAQIKKLEKCLILPTRKDGVLRKLVKKL